MKGVDGLINIPPQDKTQLVPLTVKIRPELKQTFDDYCAFLKSDPSYVLTAILTRALKGFKPEGEAKPSRKRVAAA